MAEIPFTVNQEPQTVNVDPNIPLLWVLRDILGLTGTKFSCGIGLCGTCTVHIDGKAIRSCTRPMSSVENTHVVTIEGLSVDQNHSVQKAWLAENVSQCGYCQPGQIMSAAALLSQNPNPTDGEIDAAMSDNLCRCGTYQRIKKAIRRAAVAD